MMVAIPSSSGMAPASLLRIYAPMRPASATRCPFGDRAQLAARIHLDAVHAGARSCKLVEPEHERYGLLPLEHLCHLPPCRTLLSLVGRARASLDHRVQRRDAYCTAIGRQLCVRLTRVEQRRRRSCDLEIVEHPVREDRIEIA